MTIKSRAVEYIEYLFDTFYSRFSTSGPRPYPDPAKVENAVPTQYNFNTRALPIFTRLHSLWYRFDEENKKFIKVDVLEICSLL